MAMVMAIAIVMAKVLVEEMQLGMAGVEKVLVEEQLQLGVAGAERRDLGRPYK